ncbi:uncharacterized protein LOC133037014 [Cannabis sativa]|uniref:uncharacterized protein LOC133037014 n=1 Tax=Cannabis sativa TaxID=3483 RepID=UPI0029C9DAE5|nr:uncharacterized protein LOC133037014 [Cannabis sativa]
MSYAININEDIIGHISPSRGLRQGDPLSPFLNLVCAEGLTSLIKRDIGRGTISRLQCGRRGPVISHLLFANDCFFFLEASVASCVRFRETLHQYENASGQLVNLRKLAVCFSSSIPLDFCEYLAHILGVPLVPCHDKYLGLPCFAGKSKSGLFQSIKDKIWNKLFGWKSKIFSSGRREVLLKSVIQAIPTYAMSLFRLLVGLINEIHRMCATFWWGGDNDKKKMHWCTWPRLCWHKNDGSLGFRDMFPFNQSLLAKQAARLYNSPDSLAARSGYWSTVSRLGWGQALGSLGSSRWWKLLWQQNLPPKIKKFVWKACLNFIPAYANLSHHGLKVSTVCPICFQNNETTIHAHWLCPSLKSICSGWVLSGLDSLKDASCYYELLLGCMDTLRRQELELFITLGWRIWNRRNTFVYDHKLVSDNMVSAWAMNYLWKYQDANNVVPVSMGPAPSNASNRSASSDTDLVLGEFNFFVDAGVCVENRKIGMGALVSNRMGHVLFSSAAPCAGLLEPHVVEAKALLHGLSCCVQIGYTVITAFFDYQRGVLPVNSRAPVSMKLSKNHVAHSLAKRALDLDEAWVWWPSLSTDLAV